MKTVEELRKAEQDAWHLLQRSDMVRRRKWNGLRVDWEEKHAALCDAEQAQA